MNKNGSIASYIRFLFSHFYKRLSYHLPFLPSHFDVHLKELLKGSSAAFIIRILGMGTTYLFALIITRNYGAEAMGIFALSQSALLITSLICKLGLDSASIRFVAEYSSQGQWASVKEVYRKNLTLLIPVSFLVSFLFFFFSPYIAEYIFNKPHLSSGFRIISLAVLPHAILFLHSESLRGLKKIVAYAIFRNMSIPFLASIIISVAILFSKNLQTPVISYVAGIIILSVISSVLWIKYTGISGYEVGNSISYHTILSVSLPMLLSSSMLFIMQWTDIIMLGIFRAEDETGIYHVALKVANFTSISLFAINSIAAPKFAEFYAKGNIKGLGRTAKQSTKLIFWSSFPLLLIFLFFPSYILGIFGEEFKAGAHALILIALGQFVNAVSGSVAFILQMTGKQKAFQNIMIIATILNVLLNALLIPKYGMNGAALATMIATIFRNVSSVLYIKSYLNVVTFYIPVFSSMRFRK
ncbi:MAG: flippase [wastewater metagenome]|nr:flippase [Candidatus Loosdrechtia aerotolerans]